MRKTSGGPASLQAEIRDMRLVPKILDFFFFKKKIEKFNNKETGYSVNNWFKIIE